MNLINYHLPPPDIEEMERDKDVAGLIKALRHRDLEIQWRAAESLGKLGPYGMDSLLVALKRRNKDIRLGVIEALGQIRDTRAVPPLISSLSDPDNEIRWEAALALGEIGDAAALDPLSYTLKDNDRYVRYGAALALEKMGWKPDNTAQAALYSVARQDWDSVVSYGEDAVRALRLALRDNDSSVRLDVIRTLGRIGSERAIPSLVRSLWDDDEHVRWETVLASQRCGLPLRYLPRGLSKRPKVRKNPLVSAVLNFLLPGMGYLYLGKWWGVVVFQMDVYLTLWMVVNQGEFLSYPLLLVVYLVLAIHAWYIAGKIPDL
jgi:HEAT repeat protein